VERIEIPIAPAHEVKARLLIRWDIEGWRAGYEIDLPPSCGQGRLTKSTADGVPLEFRDNAIRAMGYLIANKIRSCRPLGNSPKDKKETKAYTAAAAAVEKWVKSLKDPAGSTQPLPVVQSPEEELADARRELGDLLDKRLMDAGFDGGGDSERASLARPAVYRRIADYFDQLSGAPWEAKQKIRTAHLTPELLVLDEVQVRESDREWQDNELTSLIDRRYGDRRLTVLISNLTPDALRENLGLSIWRRLSEEGGVYEADWPRILAHLQTQDAPTGGQH
jgi:hypothetical protein